MTLASVISAAEDPRRRGLAVAALFVLGLALRLAWGIHGDHFHALIGENYEIAQAIARTGVVADAYHFGSGPTAHAAPLWPAFAGSVYRVFGLHSVASEYALTGASLAFVAVSVFFLDKTMALLGSPGIARVAAIAFIALAALNFEIEVDASRTWEQSVGAALIGFYLWLTVRLDTQVRRLDWVSVAGLVALAAPFVMICPPVALAAYGCLGLVALRRRGFHATVAAAVLAVGFVGLTAYPWAVRNERAFGEKIWLRSNFGFVFAEGFHAGAVHPADPRKAFVARMAAIDPFEREPGYTAMIAHGGEPGYERYWVAQTSAWIAAHPGDAAWIAVRHAAEFFLPPRWFWAVYSDRGSAVPAKQALTWGVTLLGFLGVSEGIIRDRRYLYCLVMITLPVVPYIVAQPILRYRYVIASLLVFLAADVVGRWLVARSGRAVPQRATA